MSGPEPLCRVLLVSPDAGEVARVRAGLGEGDVAMALEAVTTAAEAERRLATTPFDALLLPVDCSDAQALEPLTTLVAAHATLAVLAVGETPDAGARAAVLAAGAYELIARSELANPLLARLLAQAVARARIRAEAEAAQLLDASPDAVLVVDGAGIVRYVNPAARRLLSRGGDDLVGEWLGFSVGGDATDVEILGHGTPRTGEMRIADIEWQGEKAVLVSIRDVTEARQLSEQLREAQKMEVIGLMAGGLAHDFNNLLVIIMGNVDFLMEASAPEDPRRAMAERIGAAAERGRQLTRQLLLFARRRTSSPALVEPNRALFKLFDMLRRSFPADIELVVRPQHTPWHVFIDPGELDQVVLNLAFNARQALPTGGRIEIDVANVGLAAPAGQLQPGEYVAISVRDDGAGIAGRDQERIFEAFFTTKADGTGTGLGLTISQRIARRAGGDLVVESTPGEGSTFTFYLPRSKAELGELGEDGAVAGARGSERLLFVEDDRDVAEALSQALRQAGFEVVTAADGRAAQRLIEAAQTPFDIVVCDVVMPQMSGTELSAWLAETRPDTRLLLMTGFSSSSLETSAGHGPGRSLLFKPFRPAELLAAIRALIDTEI